METASKRIVFARYYEAYMFVVGLGGQLLFYIQAITIFANKSAQDVSLTGFCVSLFALASWLIYGIILKNRVLIIANIVGCVGALLVILGVMIYQS